MIRVCIFMNSKTLVEMKAFRMEGRPGERCTYKLSDGRYLTHDYDEGAVELAVRMLRMNDKNLHAEIVKRISG